MPSNDRSAPPITQPPQAGHHYSLMQVAAIAAAFVLATIALNLMPLIISATMSFLSMGEASVGAITSLELLIMSATTFVLAPWAPRLVSKYLVIIAVCLVVVAQGATLLATSTQSCHQYPKLLVDPSVGWHWRRFVIARGQYPSGQSS